jgi:hypothetical protein
MGKQLIREKSLQYGTAIAKGDITHGMDVS